MKYLNHIKTPVCLYSILLTKTGDSSLFYNHNAGNRPLSYLVTTSFIIKHITIETNNDTEYKNIKTERAFFHFDSMSFFVFSLCVNFFVIKNAKQIAKFSTEIVKISIVTLIFLLKLPYIAIASIMQSNKYPSLKWFFSDE